MKLEEVSGPKLLVIDDEAQNLRLIEAALQQKNLQIMSTTDPEEGFALFKDKRPGIVLLDLMMPKVSGMDLLERMVAIDPAAEIILITGHYTAESAVEAIRKGAADYLTKPLDIIALGERISKLITEHSERRFAKQLDQTLIDTFQLAG